MHRLIEVLSRIEWSDIRGQVGRCDQIPSALLSLGSADPQVRRKAYWSIDNHVVVQGSLYEGAFYVIPFLSELCASEDPNGRFEALSLLYEIANGMAPFDESVRFTIVDETIRHYIPSSSSSPVPLCVAVRFAAACSLTRIIPLSASQVDRERKVVHDIISLFPEHAGGLNEALLHVQNSVDREDITQELRTLRRSLRT